MPTCRRLVLIGFSVVMLMSPEVARADMASGISAYLNGDYVAALKELLPSAEKGDVQAQAYLGTMYYEGRGVQRDYSVAMKWCRLAVDQGSPMAQRVIGHMYSGGNGVVQDKREAVKWYRLSADQGYAPGQFSLAVMYERGQGVVQDGAEAVKWYLLAAKQGYDLAQANLGNMYKDGRGGIRQDDREAIKWLRLAADQGEGDAQALMGSMYAQGRGVSRDFVQAYMWLTLAVKNGAAQAEQTRRLRDLIVKNEGLTSAQIAEGEKLARDFTPRKEYEEGRSKKAVDNDRSVTVPQAPQSQDVAERPALGQDSRTLRLITAASKGDVSGVGAALSSGAKVDDSAEVDGVKGWTALMAAAKTGQTAAIDALLAAVPSLNLRNQYGATAVDIAILAGHRDIARKLFAKGAKGRDWSALPEDSTSQVTDITSSGKPAVVTNSRTREPESLKSPNQVTRESSASNPQVRRESNIVLQTSGDVVSVQADRIVLKLDDGRKAFRISKNTQICVEGYVADWQALQKVKVAKVTSPADGDIALKISNGPIEVVFGGFGTGGGANLSPVESSCKARPAKVGSQAPAPPAPAKKK